MAKPKGISVSVISEFNPKGFIEAQKEAEGLAGEFKKLAGKAAAVFAAAKVGQFAKDSIGAASDLAESANAVNVTFGDAADGILSLSEAAATTVGLSASEFNSFAVQFSGFTQQIAGFGGDVAAVTDDLTVRIADFASVMNLDVAEAAQVFQSSLAGETEPIRKFGVDLSAAAVELYALETGLIRNKGELTESIKVQARYGLLMRSTEKVAGDFANTSDSLANQQRILNAEFENAQAELGEKLLPIANDFTGALLDMLDVAEKLGVVDFIGNVLAIEELGTNIGRNLRSVFDAGARENFRYANSVQNAEDLFKQFDYTLLEGRSSLAEIQELVADNVGANSDLVDVLHLSNLVFVEQTKRIEEAAEAQERSYWSARYGASGFDELKDAVEDSKDELIEFVSVWDEEIARITREQDVADIAEDFDELRELAMEAFVAASDGAVDADEKVKEFEDGLRDSYLQALELAGQLDGLPDEVVTEIRQEFETRDLDALEVRLHNLALGVVAPLEFMMTPETAAIAGYLAMGTLREITAPAPNIPSLGTGPIGVGAYGGLVTQPTLSLIGERGPEMVVPLSQMPGASPLPSGMGGAMHVTINLPAGSNGDDVVRALQRQARRTGTLSVPTTAKVRR